MRGTDQCRGVYNWLRRTVQAYFDLDADQVPQAFLEPYDESHSAAVNNGRPTSFNYSDRKRITASHRPDTDLPEVKSLFRKAKSHALLWISCEESLEDWKVDAYLSQLNRESDRNLENLQSVSEAPPESVEEEPHQIANQISRLARIHYENGIRYTSDLENWQQARYRGFMERRNERAISEVTNLSESIPRSVEELQSQYDAAIETDGQGRTVYTGQSLEDPSKTIEKAELFLVLGGESDDERGAQLLEMSRKELCASLGLDVCVYPEVSTAGTA